MVSKPTSTKSDLFGCTLPSIFVLVVWPLIVIPYLRMRMPGVEIAPSFFQNTLIGSIIGTAVGVIGAGVLLLLGPVLAMLLGKRLQTAAAVVSAIISVGALLTCIVLLERYAFHDKQWNDLVARRRTSGTICFGAGCPAGTEPMEGGDSTTALVVIVTMQLAFCLALLAAPVMNFYASRKRQPETAAEAPESSETER